MAYGGNTYGGGTYGGAKYGGAKFGGYKTKKKKKDEARRRARVKQGKPGVDKSYKPTGLAHRGKKGGSKMASSYPMGGMRKAGKMASDEMKSAGTAQAAPKKSSMASESYGKGARTPMGYGNKQAMPKSTPDVAKAPARNPMRTKTGRKESPSSGMRRFWNSLGGKKKRDWYNEAVQRGFGRI